MIKSQKDDSLTYTSIMVKAAEESRSCTQKRIFEEVAKVVCCKKFSFALDLLNIVHFWVVEEISLNGFL